MNLILNDKEIISYLVTLFDYSKHYRELEIKDTHLSGEIAWSLSRVYRLDKFRKKIKERIAHGIELDLRNYISEVYSIIDTQKKVNANLLKNNLDYILKQLGEEKVLENYKKSVQTGFIKGTGLSLDPHANLIRRQDFTDFSQDCLFRNMQGNEQMLLTKMNNNWNFWFIDTGYTNFLNGKRKDWHRLTRNHLHHIKPFDAPVDRLGIFESFPKKWRGGGDKIMLIEPGEFSARTFGIDIEHWKKNVIEELRKYTDKKIVVREKLSKKVRNSLYKELAGDDYYCVININSNAAIESIWNGIPVITLSDHISNLVSRRNISDINNLYKGDLAKWLAMLSYCQFTYEELITGVASDIAKTYYV